MKSRREAREAALQVLYQCDTLDDWSETAVDLCFRCFLAEPAAQEDSYQFARVLIDGVRNGLAEIDQKISAASQNWSLTRMCRVDRNILRLAVYEMTFLSDVPHKVSINEAIEIARKFGTHESPMFVNGVLDRIACNLQAAA